MTQAFTHIITSFSNALIETQVLHLYVFEYLKFAETVRSPGYTEVRITYSSLFDWSLQQIQTTKQTCFSVFIHQFSPIAQSCPALRPSESQHTRPPCPSPTPGVYPNSCPLSQWCRPAISSSVVPFSSCTQSLPALGSFPMSQLFTWGGQSIGVSASASVLPMNTQDWSPLGWTGWISLQS